MSGLWSRTIKTSYSEAVRLIALAVLSAGALLATSKAPLAKGYREFLNGPTSLLLTKDERSAFNALGTDAERDTFIERFWELRNPAPGLSSNEFKEEFYRRVAYADAFYGHDSGSQGWRTDRGRTYVLFGKPQTSMDYQGNQRLYPTELWFYSNPGLSELPAFFYVLFYEPNGAGGYRLYEPYVDTPDKLLHEGGHSSSEAYNYLRRISAELANATLSWIPGEPVDTQDFTGSMASMPIVDAIHGFSNMPSYVSLIRGRALRFEQVTSKIHYKLVQSDLISFVAAEDGKSWVHWRMEVRDLTNAASLGGGKLNLGINSKLYSQGRLVFEQNDTPSIPLTAKSDPQTGNRPVLYEDKIPIEAGKYQLSVEMKNQDTGAVYAASREFEVASPASDRTAVGDVLVVAKHRPDKRSRPFDFSGVEFVPAPENNVMSSRGLSVLYQIHLPPTRPAQLLVHYTVGSGSGTSRKSFEEKIDPSKADVDGSLLTAKTLPIAEFGPGTYRLSIQVEDPDTRRTATAAVPFTVLPDVPDENPITIARGQNDTPQIRAVVDYERALCLLAQNRPAEALKDLQSAWQLGKNTDVKSLLDRLSAIQAAGSTNPTIHVKE